MIVATVRSDLDVGTVTPLPVSFPARRRCYRSLSDN